MEFTDNAIATNGGELDENERLPVFILERARARYNIVLLAQHSGLEFTIFVRTSAHQRLATVSP